MQSVTSRRHATGRRSPIGLATRLKCPPSFSLRETVLSHGWYELVPFRWEDASSTLYRAEVLPDGSLHYFSLRQPGRLGRSIQIRWLTGDPAKEPKSILIARIRRILNLDLDLAPFLSLCRREPRLRYVPRRGAGRFLRCGNLYEEVFKAICGTNIAWKQAVLAINRVGTLGEPMGEFGLNAFPGAEKLLRVGESRLREVSRLGYRVPYLLDWSRRVAEGETGLDQVESGRVAPEEQKRFRLSVRGVGKATAQYLLMVWGSGQEIPVDSSVILYCRRNRFGGRIPSEREIRAMYEPYAPWSAYVYWFEFLPWAREHWGFNRNPRT